MTGQRLQPTGYGLPMLVAIAATLLSAAVAAGQPAPRGVAVGASDSGPDYNPALQGWNGASYLVETAEEARVDLEPLSTLDWERVDRRDVLVFVFPLRPLDEVAIDAFLRDGGRIVIADDFGASEGLLAKWGLTRIRPPLAHGNVLRGNPAWPVLEVSGGHFLFFNIESLDETLLGNHSVGLRWEEPARPIVTYDDPRLAFAAEVAAHEGAILAIADASLFINSMLYWHGNKQFVANSLRYFCRGDPCRAKLVLPWAPHVGSYVGSDGPDTLREWARESVELFNEGVESLLGLLSARAWVKLLAFAALGLILGALTRLFAPLKPLSRLSWESNGARNTTEIDDLAQGLSDARQSADFRRPAEALASLLRAALSLRERDTAVTETERVALASRFVRRYRTQPADRGPVRQAVVASAAFCESMVQSTADAGRPVSAAQFESALESARIVLRAAGAKTPEQWVSLAGGSRPRPTPSPINPS